MTGANWMKLVFPPESVNVSFARTTVALFASQLDFTLDELEDIKLAVSEAVSNAIIHGYREMNGTVEVEGQYGDGYLTVWVRDYGIGIEDLDAVRDAGCTTMPEERMGLGFALIYESMDEIQIDTAPGQGTSVRMVKTVRPVVE